jgi:hypothetical protein
MKPALNPPPLPDLKNNKIKRITLDLLLRGNPEMQAEIKQRCANDFVFWAEHFCYAYDEQTVGAEKRIPLVLYEFQKEMCLEIVRQIWMAANDPIYRWNGGADKARKMTATFSALLVGQWFAQFHGISGILTSKSLDECDRPGDMNTPFERLRWQVQQQYELYPWLFPAEFNYNNKQHQKTRLINFQNGGQISGQAPNGAGMRQGRGLWWIGDEFAFVEEDGPCYEASSGTVRIRLLFSTPKDPLTRFYQLVYHTEGEQFHVFELDWWKHPEYAQGLYTKPDGSYSSPYFDNILRTNPARVVAKEYLRDHENASGGRVFKMFRPEASCVPDLKPDPRVRTIYRIWDPGLTFAVTWGQVDRYGRLLLLRELVMTNEQVSAANTLLHMIAERALRITEESFHEFEIIDIGDPYGSRPQISAQAKEDTEYELLWKHYKIRVQSSFMYKIAAHERKEKRHELLGDLMVQDIEVDEGTTTPKLLINSGEHGCKIGIEAFKGKYRREVDPNTGEELESIKKAHPWIDVVDCHGMLAVKVFYSERNTNATGFGTKRGRGKVWRRSVGRR